MPIKRQKNYLPFFLDKLNGVRMKDKTERAAWSEEKLKNDVVDFLVGLFPGLEVLYTVFAKISEDGDFNRKIHVWVPSKKLDYMVESLADLAVIKAEQDKISRRSQLSLVVSH